MNDAQNSHHIDRLLDAIDLVKSDQRDQAQMMLRDLIAENGDFEDAWLWMSVAVKSLDQSAVCLENVLRINPQNSAAASALYRLRYSDMEQEKRRSKLRFWRDMAMLGFWILGLGLLSALFSTLYLGAQKTWEWMLTQTPVMTLP